MITPLWGAPRIHGDLLKLRIDIAQSTVAKYMPHGHGPPPPGLRPFLRSHTAHIAAIDLFVIPTIGFKLLYGLVILRLERRRLVWTNVTRHPTAEWIAPDRSPKHSRGTRHRVTSSVTATLHMESR